MPIAAVPKYLGKDFESASPGLRFGMYLPIWTTRADQETEVKKRADAKSREGDEVRALLTKGMDTAIAELTQRERKPLPKLWAKNDSAANQTWQKITELNVCDKETLQALADRQTAAFDHAPSAHSLRLDACSVAPFTTGLGNEHPLENGFAFLNPYGLPYLPGSGVKGVLRAAASELAGGEWAQSGDKSDWSHDQRHEVPDEQGQRLFDASDIEVLFGNAPEADQNHLQGVLRFWDVIPQIAENSLMVEIMTPHQSHYYQQELNKKSGNSTSPHDSGSPNPIVFLTVPPGAGFAFHVLCDTVRLEKIAPDLAHNGRWKTLLKQAFEHAFAWLGFGAKTAVGYGAMRCDPQAQAKREREQAAAAEKAAQARAVAAEKAAQAKAAADQAAKMASLSANMRLVEEFSLACKRRAEELRGNKEKPNTQTHAKARELAKAAHESAGWSAEEKRAAADALAEWLPQVVSVDMKDERKKLKLAALRGEA